MRHSRIFIGLLLISIAGMTGGCLNVHLRSANEYYQQFAYASAANEYEYVLSRKIIPEATANIADCYLQMGNSVKTEYWYRRAIKLPDARPEWNLFLAQAMMRNGNYKEAKVHIEKYLEFNKSDFKAQRMLNACDSIAVFYRDTTLYSISLLKFNTPHDNFFSPAFFRSGIVFLSDRSVKGLSKAVSDGTGNRFLDLFYAKKTDRGNWMDIEPLRGDVNGKFNEGPVVFSNGYNTMYFTRNNYVSNRAEKNNKNVNVLKIFKADNELGEWKIKGPMYFNSNEYSVGHPALNASGAMMIFSSDMPWGYGGSDLYMVRWEGGERWSNPVNLGAGVNTEGNELFPFMANDSLLYFASDGRTGMGGLDIYESKFVQGEWSTAENLGYPINSSQDDFSFIMDSTGMEGYFSSSRNGNVDKIYGFEKHPPQLNMFLAITEVQAGTPIPGVRVKMMVDNANEKIFTTNGLGELKLDVQPGHVYKFRCDHPEYFLVTTEESTVGLKFSDTLKVKVELRKVQLNKPFVWQGVAFKKKDYQLKVTSGEALQFLSTLLLDNSRLQVEIGSYTDSRNSDADNIILTQKRAELVLSYLVTQGIAESRLSAKGYGEAKLLNKCVNGILCIEEEHERNNRIEITVKAISKDAGMP
jgi:outer membrane protein OmpA-like peptidoglycan-associated protein/tetratricopeptide (TPR) repeat protein